MRPRILYKAKRKNQKEENKRGRVSIEQPIFGKIRKEE